MAFQVKEYETIVNDLVQNLIDNNQELSDLNVGSIIRSLVEAYALELNSEELNGLYQQIQEVYNATRISTAEGDDLDELASLVGVVRQEGIKSTTTLTLQRSNPAVSSFIVASGSIFSTQPVSGEDALRFLSTTNNTFEASILNESNDYVDGIYLYRLQERFYSDVSEITGLVAAAPNTFVEDTDYQEVKGYEGTIVDVSTVDVLEDCEAITGWSGSTDATAIAVDAVNKRQGTNSLELGKTGITEDFIYYERTNVTALDLTNKKLNLKIRIDDGTTLNNLVSVQILIGEDSSNYLSFVIAAETLSIGWNEIFLDPEDASVTGAPLVTNITFKRLRFNVLNSTITIPTGKLNMDFWIFCETEEYVGDIVEWLDTGTLPDDASSTSTDYIPLSKEIEIEAEEVGTNYNVAVDKIIFKVSAIPNVTSVNNYIIGSNGDDIEVDADLRERVLNASFAIGKATVNAIEQGVLGLDFITSVNVDDMPLKQVPTETNTYSTGTSEYLLDFEVAQNDSYLQVLGHADALNGGIDDSVATITVNDTTDFNTAGYIIIDSEIISYTGTTGTDFTGCTRGVQSTIAAAHSDTTAVSEWFEPAVDYVISNLSEVSWIGNTPPNTVVFDTKYQYRWLGHIEVFVIGPLTFTAPQQTEIEDTIEEYKAAGIFYTWASPTNVPINVTMNIKLLNGYDFATVQTNVEDALRDKLNSYDIGESVFLSQLIDTAHNVDGIDYVVLVTPSADVTIATNELSRSGTIIVTQIV